MTILLAVIVHTAGLASAAGLSALGRSPISVFSPGMVLAPTASTFFSEKGVASQVLAQDTLIGGVLVPAGASVQQAQYATLCTVSDCINLDAMTSQQNAEIHDRILNRGAELSRLSPQNYMAQPNSAQRQVWRWSVMGDGLPLSQVNADQFRAAGVSIIPTLTADNPAFRDPMFPGGRGCMTSDFTNVFNATYGYSSLYFDWVTRLVTAKYAIRQAGLSILVADSGMMGGSWIRMASTDLIMDRAAIVAAGQIPSAELENQILELISQINTVIPTTMVGDVDWTAIEAAAAGPGTLPVQNAREVIRLLNADVIDPDLGEPAMGLLADKDNKTLAANNVSLLAFTEFLPVSSYFPDGEIEALGGAMAFSTLVPIPPPP